jgi:hypothetical protein
VKNMTAEEAMEKITPIFNKMTPEQQQDVLNYALQLKKEHDEEKARNLSN